ncbi:MAG: tetratricopeptide repeat protein, partial [bacterium]
MFIKHPVKILGNSGWFILLIGITTCATAQQWTTVKRMPEKESEFRRALRQYISKDYEAAFVSFESLTNSKELHQRMTASLLMTGKCLYNLDRFTDAIPYFEQLINLFPRSKYVDDAYFAKAACNYSLGQYLHAAQDLLWIVDASSEDRLISKSIKFVNLVMQSKLTLTELHNLLQFAQGENSSALVMLKLAQKELLEGSNEKAVAILKDYKQKYRSKKYASKIDLLLKEAERPGARPIKLGVILPLTG